MEHAHWIGLGTAATLQDVEGTVDNAFGRGLLTIVHQRVHEAADDDITELGVREDFALIGAVTTRHAIDPLLRPLGAIQRPALTTLRNALGIQDATQDVIANARKILHATAADQHHRVFLKIVALAGNVAHNLIAVRQAHLGDLTQRGVRLLRGGRVHARANTALLGAPLERRNRVPGL